MWMEQPPSAARVPGARRRNDTALARIGAVITMALVAGACGSSAATPTSSQSAPSTATPTPFALPAFYAVPSTLPDQPGMLIKDTPVAVTAEHIHATAYLVMYTSQDEQGKVVAVTGVLYLPLAPPPAGGFPVVAWAHGTNGMGDPCTPSLDPGTAVPSLASVNDILAHGWEFASTDYQGEGTPPGLLAYLVGNVAAWDTIDLVRAAQQIPAAHASTTYVVWGHSEGGQAAMFAWELGPAYTPELHLAGVVAGAPPSEFATLLPGQESGLIMIVAGFNQAYGDAQAPLSAVLTARGTDLLPILRQDCLDDIEVAVNHYPASSVLSHDPMTVPPWSALLLANDSGQFTSGSNVPLLIIQGADDDLVPVTTTQQLAAHLCGIGEEVQRWLYPGEGHAEVITPSTPDMVQWIADRFAGTAFPDSMQPSGLPGVIDQDCQTPGGFTSS
jgi:pimeloyl-ACP methyl ester carboxylesterase